VNQPLPRKEERASPLLSTLPSQIAQMQRAAVLLPPEQEALVLPMCQLRQGNGLRSLLCLDSADSQFVAPLNRNPKL
jgi:hypothetical protein